MPVPQLKEEEFDKNIYDAYLNKAKDKNYILKTHDLNLYIPYVGFGHYICIKCNIMITIADNIVIWVANTNNRNIISCDEMIIKGIIE